MTQTKWFIVLVVAYLYSGITAYIFGWNAGVKDTERRWTDAVGRAHDRVDR